MFEFLNNIHLFPFYLSLIILLILIMAETIGAYISLRPSQLIRYIFPRRMHQLSFLDVKFSKFLVLIFFLLNFSISGFFIQFFAFYDLHSFFEFYYAIPLASLITIICTLFMIHSLNQMIKPHCTEQHSNLIGCLATICRGNARPGFAAQAKLRDANGQLHLVQVEPEFGELELHSHIILIQYRHTYYVAKRIAYTNEPL